MAKQPSESDKIVRVRAYLTDEAFGYEHWRAAQFAAPKEGQPALLLLCRDDHEREVMLEHLKASNIANIMLGIG